MPWLLIAYQTPALPSTARVSAWRGLHGLGALYLGPSVCLLPRQIGDPARLDAIADRALAAGGTFEVLEVTAFAADAEDRLEARYNEARGAEYMEIVEQAHAIVDEIERESAGVKFTFAEVEENEAGVAKLRLWVRRVGVRDLFGCEARAAAEAALRRAEERLAAFIELAVARESATNDTGSATAAGQLRVVGDDERAL